MYFPEVEEISGVERLPQNNGLGCKVISQTCPTRRGISTNLAPSDRAIDRLGRRDASEAGRAPHDYEMCRIHRRKSCIATSVIASRSTTDHTQSFTCRRRNDKHFFEITARKSEVKKFFLNNSRTKGATEKCFR